MHSSHICPCFSCSISWFYLLQNSKIRALLAGKPVLIKSNLKRRTPFQWWHRNFTQWFLDLWSSADQKLTRIIPRMNKMLWINRDWLDTPEEIWCLPYHEELKHFEMGTEWLEKRHQAEFKLRKFTSLNSMMRKSMRNLTGYRLGVEQKSVGCSVIKGLISPFTAVGLFQY